MEQLTQNSPKEKETLDELVELKNKLNTTFYNLPWYFSIAWWKIEKIEKYLNDLIERWEKYEEKDISDLILYYENFCLAEKWEVNNEIINKLKLLSKWEVSKEVEKWVNFWKWLIDKILTRFWFWKNNPEQELVWE